MTLNLAKGEISSTIHTEWKPGFQRQLGQQGRKELLSLVRGANKVNKANCERILKGAPFYSNISRLPYFHVEELWNLVWKLREFFPDIWENASNIQESSKQESTKRSSKLPLKTHSVKPNKTRKIVDGESTLKDSQSITSPSLSTSMTDTADNSQLSTYSTPEDKEFLSSSRDPLLIQLLPSHTEASQETTNKCTEFIEKNSPTNHETETPPPQDPALLNNVYNPLPFERRETKQRARSVKSKTPLQPTKPRPNTKKGNNSKSFFSSPNNISPTLNPKGNSRKFSKNAVSKIKCSKFSNAFLKEPQLLIDEIPTTPSSSIDLEHSGCIDSPKMYSPYYADTNVKDCSSDKPNDLISHLQNNLILPDLDSSEVFTTQTALSNGTTNSNFRLPALSEFFIEDKKSQESENLFIPALSIHNSTDLSLNEKTLSTESKLKITHITSKQHLFDFATKNTNPSIIDVSECLPPNLHNQSFYINCNLNTLIPLINFLNMFKNLYPQYLDTQVCAL